MEFVSSMPRIDLIISDFRLSEDVNGVELIRGLRAIKSDVPVPALIVTGDTEEIVIEHIAGSGIAYTNKPVKASVLAAKIKELLTESAGGTERRTTRHPFQPDHANNTSTFTEARLPTL